MFALNPFGARTRPTSARGAAAGTNRGTTRGPNRPRGMTSVLAMLYLVIFAALALGFYAQTNISAQVSGGEFRGVEAQLATESGLQFIRYQLSCMKIPPSYTPANAFEELYQQLGDRLEGWPNLGTKILGYSPAAAGKPANIRIPNAATDFIQIAAKGPRFRVVITDASPKLDVKVVGTSGNGRVTRAVQLQFQRAPKPYALVGINSLTLSGTAFSDSYDATKGDATKVGRYAAASARAGGSMASNGNVTLSNTAKVNGDVRYGSGSTLTVAPTATINGLAAPVTSTPSFPSVTLPATYTDLGDVTQSSGTMSIAGGTYLINRLNLSATAKVIWTGPVKLYIKTSYSVTGTVSISTYDNLPANRQIFFLPTCTTATWGGTNVSVGELYAPDTDFVIKDSVEMMGRVIAKSIANSSSGGMHYDESLAAPGALPISYSPVVMSYLEVTP